MIELMVLTNLMLGPCHGYELKKLLRGMKLNNNTLYPLLKKLENNGCLQVELIQQENKPAKKVYTITDAGKEHLYELLRDFDTNKALNNDEFYFRVAFFQFLEKEDIKAILDTRLSALENDITNEKALSFLEGFPDKAYDLLYLHNFVTSEKNESKKLVAELKKKYGIED